MLPQLQHWLTADDLYSIDLEIQPAMFSSMNVYRTSNQMTSHPHRGMYQMLTKTVIINYSRDPRPKLEECTRTGCYNQVFIDNVTFGRRIHCSFLWRLTFLLRKLFHVIRIIFSFL